MAKQSKLRQPYTLYQRGDVWHIRYSFLNAQRQRIQLRETCATTDYEQAREYAENRYIKLKQKANRQAGELEEVTIDEAFGRFYAEHAQYLETPNMYISRLNTLKKELGIKYLHEITEDILSTWVAKRRRHKDKVYTVKSYHLSNGTINRYLSMLSKLLNKYKKIYKTQDINIHALMLPEKAENVSYAKDMKVIDTILSRASIHIRPIILTALMTGFRLSNNLNLRENNVDFINKQINIMVKDKTTEGGRLHTIPLIPKLEAILKEQKTIDGYFFHYQKKPIKRITSAWWNIFFIRDKEKGSKEFERDENGDKILRDPRLPYIRFHDLRHTCATWLLRESGNMKLVQEILGHKDMKTTAKYAHILTEQKREALEDLFG